MARKIKRTKTTSESTINRQIFLNTLRSIHLSGMINECMLIFKKGELTSETVDITNNIIVLVNNKMASKNFDKTIGIGNIDILIKYLSSITDKELKISVSKNENEFILSTKSKSRKLVYLTTLSEFIPTRLRLDDDDTNYFDEFQNMPSVSFVITQEEAKDLISYVGLTRSKTLLIESEKDSVIFKIGSGTEHRFQISIKLDENNKEIFAVKTNGENLSKILGTCNFSEDFPTTIGICKNKPIVVTDSETLWSLTPLEDDTEED